MQLLLNYCVSVGLVRSKLRVRLWRNCCLLSETECLKLNNHEYVLELKSYIFFFRTCKKCQCNRRSLFICLFYWNLCVINFFTYFNSKWNASILLQTLQLVLVYSTLQIRHEFYFWSSSSYYYAVIKQPTSCCFVGCWNFVSSKGTDAFPLYHRSDCGMF